MSQTNANILTLRDGQLAASRNASALPRVSSRCRVECIKDAAAFEALKAPMAVLAETSLEPALCSEFAWINAGLRYLAESAGDVCVALVWRDDSVNDGRELIGAFVQKTSRRLPFLPVRQAKSWKHIFCPLCTPLVHCDHAAEALETYFNWVFGPDVTATTLMWEQVPVSGPLAEVIEDTSRATGSRQRSINSHRRAVLEVPEDLDSYLVHSLPRKKRKELRRLRARLGEQGRLSVEQFPIGGDLGQWLKEFYALEARGWKGRAKTALSCDPGWTGFFDQAMADLDGQGDVLFWKLCLNGVPVAMTFGARRGRHAWLCKIAYDEDYARFSPGVLIVLDAMGILAAGGAIDTIDSCAQADHPMIDHLWRERLDLHDIVIGRPRQSRLMFAMVCRLADLKREGREAVKRLYRKYLKGGHK